MHATRRRSNLRQSLAWLLWLVLLVPLAQTAAVVHAYSHVRTEASAQRGSDQAPQASHCDFCLTAADLTGGAMLAGQPSLSVAGGPAASPHVGADSVWRALPTLGYRSRAPPLSAH
jgi:hypothetical protein